jgi:hypothetical protein
VVVACRHEQANHFAVRGHVVFVGGYFYDPHFGPYPGDARLGTTFDTGQGGESLRLALRAHRHLTARIDRERSAANQSVGPG